MRGCILTEFAFKCRGVTINSNVNMHVLWLKFALVADVRRLMLRCHFLRSFDTLGYSLSEFFGVLSEHFLSR
jgi:hypothetical protein